MISKISEPDIQETKRISKKIRQNILMMIHKAQSGHPGGSLSCVEILYVLFNYCMVHYTDWDKNKYLNSRDRFLL